METKGKTEELLFKQLKTFERNMQEFTYSIKRTNLRIMEIEEGEEGQTKGIHIIFNKIITENFPNLDKAMPKQVQEASRTPNIIDQNRITHDMLSLKQQAQRKRKKIECCKREKPTYKG
jgi:hypothetical protein